MFYRATRTTWSPLAGTKVGKEPQTFRGSRLGQQHRLKTLNLFVAVYTALVPSAIFGGVQRKHAHMTTSVPGLLRVREVADRLNTHPMTVRRMIGDGRLAAVRLGVGGPFRVPAAAVDALLLPARDEEAA
jgi:excisionase family DNA binding protein